MNSLLTRNFSVQEVYEWPFKINMPADDQKKAYEMAYNLYIDNPEIKNRCDLIARECQIIRNELNKAFQGYNGRIGLQVTSWLRSVEWEVYRGRNGSSQHTQGWAIDFVTTMETQKTMAWLWNFLQNWQGGLARKMDGDEFVFIHIDLGDERRWTY